MAKSTVTLSIDNEVMEQARERIDNISGLVENFLKTYLDIGPSEDIPEAMLEIIKEEENLMVQKIKINARLEKIARIKKKQGSIQLDFSK